jgi:hypothetical protein
VLFCKSTPIESVDTSTVSEVVPTGIVSFSVNAWFTVRLKVGISTVLKPCFLIFAVYGPGSIFRNTKPPLPFVAAWLTTFVSRFVSVTSAPTITCPSVSLTVPLMDPDVCCPNMIAGAIDISAPKVNETILLRIMEAPP